MALTVDHIQQRDGRWVIVDLRGKYGRIRTVAVPAWVKEAVDLWYEAAAVSTLQQARDNALCANAH